jgi:hypothetical protein
VTQEEVHLLAALTRSTYSTLLHGSHTLRIASYSPTTSPHYSPPGLRAHDRWGRSASRYRLGAYVGDRDWRGADIREQVCWCVRHPTTTCSAHHHLFTHPPLVQPTTTCSPTHHLFTKPPLVHPNHHLFSPTTTCSPNHHFFTHQIFPSGMARGTCQASQRGHGAEEIDRAV